ncbi:class I SAM-dependent methyltransferase [Streptomyces sp. NPDC059176]|uniref:class I SAM-dependent methyltransferase n=1 Tax=Streptomyces sp. NPDC059176 TaxID=3346758 RepID=UPI0036BF886E
MADSPNLPVDLSGVSESLLWNLYQRAAEASRRDAILRDPKAVELVRLIDYPFAEKFGKGKLGQWQALRVLCFDQQVGAFLREHPCGQVVALGEGLETQFWRVDNGQVRWLGVELPDIVELRGQLLPDEEPRQRTVACSALSEEWMEHVDASDGLLLTAQGLFMYFQPEEVHALITTCARRFPGAALVFDGVPPWFSERTLAGKMKTSGGYASPPMPWAIDAAEKDRLRALPNVAEVSDLIPPAGRGLLRGHVYPLLNRLSAVREMGLTGLPLQRLCFGHDPAAG